MRGLDLLRRRRLFISGMQYRLLVSALLHFAAVVLAFFASVFLPVILALDDPAAAAWERDQAARSLLVLHERVWIAVPIIGLLIALHTVVESHRIAGPLYRFKLFFKTLGDGDFSRSVAIRQNDYLWGEVQAINEMIDGIVARLDSVRGSYEEAGRTLPDLAQALEAGDADEAKLLAGKLGIRLDELGRSLRAFRLPERGTVPAPRAVPAPPERRADPVPART